MSPKQTGVRDALLADVEEHPESSQVDLAARHGVSKQRIHQILPPDLRALLMAIRPRPRCQDCGKPLSRPGRRKSSRCRPCAVARNTYACEVCGKPTYVIPARADRTSYATCSRSCRAIRYHQLAGDGSAGRRNLSAWHAKQREALACHHGHPWTPENTYLRNNGQRACRECEHIRYLARKERKANFCLLPPMLRNDVTALGNENP